MDKLYSVAILTAALLLVPLVVCHAEETKTVEWYLTTENKAAWEFLKSSNGGEGGLRIKICN